MKLTTTLGVLSQDDNELACRKKNFNEVVLMLMGAGLIWGTLYALLGYTLPALAPFLFVVVLSGGLLYYNSSGNLPFISTLTALLMLITPVAFQWLMGGIENTGGVMLWSIFAPIGAMIFLRQDRALYWLFGYLLLVVGSGLANHWLATQVAPAPPMMQNISFAGTYASVSVVIFLMIRSYLVRMQDARQELMKQKEELEASYRELAVHEEELRQNLEEISAQQDELTRTERALRDNQKQLEQTNENLEAMVAERTQQLAEKTESITDSIKYARRIQQSVLPTRVDINENLPKNYLFYQAKDILCGDFYWFKKQGDKLLLAAADCTGHGVPGAFMSLLGNNILNLITGGADGLTDPGTILDQLDHHMQRALNQNGADGVQDGMDIAFVSLDKGKGELQFAGAFRPLVLRRKEGLVEELKGDRRPIGNSGLYTNGKGPQNFTTQTLAVQPGDRFFIFSDGIPDQHGGPENRKLGSKRLYEYIQQTSRQSIDYQGEALREMFMEWKGTTPQTDDIVFLGVEV